MEMDTTVKGEEAIISTVTWDINDSIVIKTH